MINLNVTVTKHHKYTSSFLSNYINIKNVANIIHIRTNSMAYQKCLLKISFTPLCSLKGYGIP